MLRGGWFSRFAGGVREAVDTVGAGLALSEKEKAFLCLLVAFAAAGKGLILNHHIPIQVSETIRSSQVDEKYTVTRY